jgi:hypothetical protein
MRGCSTFEPPVRTSGVSWCMLTAHWRAGDSVCVMHSFSRLGAERLHVHVRGHIPSVSHAACFGPSQHVFAVKIL